jgi:hypothetical protein
MFKFQTPDKDFVGAFAFALVADRTGQNHVLNLVAAASAKWVHVVYRSNPLAPFQPVLDHPGLMGVCPDKGNGAVVTIKPTIALSQLIPKMMD